MDAVEVMMRRTKVCLLALALVATAGGAWAADETWPLEAARGRLNFHPDIIRDLGISASPSLPPDTYQRIPTVFEASGRLELRAPGSLFTDIGDGELRVTSAGVLRLGDTEVPMQSLTIQRGTEERTFSILAGGRVLFNADHMHFKVERGAGQIRMFNLDLRLAPEAARALGNENLVDVAVAVMELEGRVQIPAGSVEVTEGGCSNPNWGLPDVDAQMTAIGSIQQVGSLGGLVAIAPSASLMNVGSTDVPWYGKFSGNFPPYNNDQHPYLIWDMYRLSNGVLEQIGVSPLKHAFLTINSGCGCSSGNIMWVGCSDTYGVGNNDSIQDLTLRHEITAFSGVWQRCGSIFDPDCNGIPNSAPPRVDAMDRRMAVAVADLTTPGASYFFDAWYIARDDTNIFNTISWRPVTPSCSGSNCTFSLGGMTLGPVVDQWINPSNPGPNAQSVAVNTVLGRVRVLAKAFDQGGGIWRYEYAIQNFDFDPRIRSITIPLGPGVVASNPGFHDPDQNAANNWVPTISPGSITFTAPSDAAAQDYGTLYNFRFTANAVPSAPSGTTLSLKVQEAKVWKLTPALVGPGLVTHPASDSASR
jgi:hypothetical protein